MLYPILANNIASANAILNFVDGFEDDAMDGDNLENDVGKKVQDIRQCVNDPTTAKKIVNEYQRLKLKYRHDRSRLFRN